MGSSLILSSAELGQACESLQEDCKKRAQSHSLSDPRHPSSSYKGRLLTEHSDRNPRIISYENTLRSGLDSAVVLFGLAFDFHG